MARTVWAIVVAAGSGSRFGGRKQFGLIDRRSVVSLAASSLAGSIDGLVVVLPPDVAAEPDPLAACGLLPTSDDLDPDLPVVAVAGGETRAASVRAGLAALPPECTTVVVHDAARPLASEALCRAVLAAVEAGADGAIPGLPLDDTVKEVREGSVVGTLDRDRLVRVQTPQAFAADRLRAAHASGPEATDDAALVEAAGGTVVVVPGEPHNLKVTSPDDLDLARWWYHRLSEAAALAAESAR